MIRKTILRPFGLVLLLLILAVSPAVGAGSFSNSLTGFTGNSTQVATQNALAAAGFNLESTAGFIEDPPGSGEFIDPTVNFDSSGPHFGELFIDAPGRNYLRTNDADYGNVSFVAEITFVAPGIDDQEVYFGLGAGDAGFFRTPDWGTENSSVMYWGENEIADPTVTVYRNTNGDGPSTYTPAPDQGDGTHRVRMSFDWFEKTATFSFDHNYAGGAFTADVTAPPMNVIANYGADGWPTEPGRIYFGGSDGMVVKDFQVTVLGSPVVYGDFNNSGGIPTETDWAILRSNMHKDLSGMTFEQAYFLGDLTADKANNHDDFVVFKELYEAAHGAGSFARMVAGVPEPSTAVLVSFAALSGLAVRRRAANRS